MARDGGEIVRRARLAVGTPFRPQGRTIEEGLDCIGLAAFAYRAGPLVPRDYALRGTRIETLARTFAKHHLVPVEAGPARAGDIAVFRPGPGQLHLAVVTGDSLIHADARLRRVVERPMPAPWPLAGLWRLRSLLEES